MSREQASRTSWCSARRPAPDLDSSGTLMPAPGRRPQRPDAAEDERLGDARRDQLPAELVDAHSRREAGPGNRKPPLRDFVQQPRCGAFHGADDGTRTHGTWLGKPCREHDVRQRAGTRDDLTVWVRVATPWGECSCGRWSAWFARLGAISGAHGLAPVLPHLERSVELLPRLSALPSPPLDLLKLDGAAWTTSETFDDGRALFTAVCNLGFEGVIAKNHSSLYRPNDRARVKIKNPGYWRLDAELDAMRQSG